MTENRKLSTLDPAGSVSGSDLVYVVQNGVSKKATASQLPVTTAIAAGYQPLDADLTAIAALSTTAYGRALLAMANAAAVKAVLSLVKGDVGLDDVDNTADADKPVSTAAQAALDGKVGKSGLQAMAGPLTLSTTLNPRLIWTATSNATDEKIWDAVVVGDELQFRAIDDANANATTFASFKRTGYAVESLTIGGNTMVDGPLGIGRAPVALRALVTQAPSSLNLAAQFVEFAGVQTILLRPNTSGINLITSDYLSGSTNLPLALSARSITSDLLLDTDGNVGIGAPTLYSRFTVLPLTDPTTLAGISQLAVGESGNNPNYRLKLGYALVSASWHGVIDALAGGVGTDLVLNPSGGPVVIGGGQLQFPATQNPSSDANTFDDCEKGSFTPSLSFGGASVGITYTTASGRYTKHGRVVEVEGTVVLTNKGSSTGAVLIGGLPFTPNGSFAGIGVASFFNAASLSGLVMAYGTLGGSYVGLQVQGSASYAALTDANFNNTTECYFSLTYSV